MKKKYTPFILIFLLCVTFWISWSYPFIKFRNDEIATGHMLKSIEKISHTPHSFRNPKERAMVRSFLTEQLQKQGAQVQLFSYDSIPTRTGDSVRITNIYARLDPKQVHDSTQYILFLAHYDSSGKTSALTPDSTYSFGAADDGYGLAVILETVRRLKQTHSEWRQGIKVLFTDLEEEHMAGMKKALERNPEIFDQVNFAINIEARGVKGPALLFETSPRNEKLMQLYRVASDTYSYSLTSAVYRVMPNYTDFACIRNQIPGLNFAVIDNLNYYHTEQDQFTNVSEKSLNHYLRQITPITRKYLTDPYFSAPDALQGKRDRIFFLFPPFGTLLFSITTWKIITYAIIFLFGFTLFLLRKNKYICRRSLLAKTGIVFSVTTGIIIAGTGIAYAITHLAGRVYNPILTLYVPFDGTITIGLLILTIFLFGFLSRRKQQITDLAEYIAAISLVYLSVAIPLSFWLVENFFLILPVLCTTTALLFLIYRRVFNLFFYMIPVMSVILIEVAFLKQLYFALTFGALGGILAFGSSLGILILFLCRLAITISESVKKDI